MSSSTVDTCSYCAPDNQRCDNPAEAGTDQCQWHSGRSPASPESLEKMVADERSLAGFNLQHCELESVNLIGADLRYADLSRANLSCAHLYGANLGHSNLFKADLSYANLRSADLIECNLLGANLEGAKLENVRWGRDHIIINELQARSAARKRNHQAALQKYREAEEIYRNIKLAHRSQGHGKEESPFFYREMVVQRKQMPLFSMRRIWSKFMDLTTGYGEKPMRVVSTMLADIVLAAILYGILGVRYADAYLGFGQSNLNIGETIFNLLYFSTVVFTTVGFGDITPVGFSKAVMMVQGLSGQILIAFFIVALYKKLMSR